LEIGTGTGLLAMIAVRAGAAEVITCEKTLAIAHMATEIVARNGYADHVRIIAKHSDELDVEADLGGPADILVSKIVSNDLLGEPAHERAVRNLLKPGGRVIPARGRIRVALAEDAHTGRSGWAKSMDLIFRRSTNSRRRCGRSASVTNGCSCAEIRPISSPSTSPQAAFARPPARQSFATPKAGA
jgi:hypothetical protein